MCTFQTQMLKKWRLSSNQFARRTVVRIPGGLFKKYTIKRSFQNNPQRCLPTKYMKHFDGQHPFGNPAAMCNKLNMVLGFAPRPCDRFALIEDEEAQQANFLRE